MYQLSFSKVNKINQMKVKKLSKQYWNKMFNELWFFVLYYK